MSSQINLSEHSLESNLDVKNGSNKLRTFNLFTNYRKIFGGDIISGMVQVKKDEVADSQEKDVSEVSFFTVNPEVDAKLHDLFFRINAYSHDPLKRTKEREKYNSLVVELKHTVDGLTPEEKKDFQETYEALTGLEKQRYLDKRISESFNRKMDNSVFQKSREFWWNERKKADEKFQKGEKSYNEYLEDLEKINKQAIGETGDEELEKLWEGYQKDKGSYENLSEEKSEAVGSDEPVKNKDAVLEAFQEVGESGMDINFNEGGYATVMLGEQFPVEISVYRNNNTNETVYYFADKYAENGVVRVTADKLLVELDRRHVDAYLSKKMGKQLLDDYQSVGEIPDKDLILLGETLLLPGEDRHYKIVGEERRLMDALVQLLVENDDGFSNLYKKIRALNKYFEVKDNVQYARTRILNGKVFSVSELIGP